VTLAWPAPKARAIGAGHRAWRCKSAAWSTGCRAGSLDESFPPAPQWRNQTSVGSVALRRASMNSPPSSWKVFLDSALALHSEHAVREDGQKRLLGSRRPSSCRSSHPARSTRSSDSRGQTQRSADRAPRMPSSPRCHTGASNGVAPRCAARPLDQCCSRRCAWRPRRRLCCVTGPSSGAPGRE